MHIREAKLEDSKELQNLQSQCSQGTSLIVSIVNIPDFFTRLKCYDKCKTFVACDDDNDRIVGALSCAVHDANVNGKPMKIGFEFLAFVLPYRRRKGIAKMLRKETENYLIQNGACLSYALVMEKNFPSMWFLESEGFRLHKKLVHPAIRIMKEIKLTIQGVIRTPRSQDFSKIAALLNQTWHGYELYDSMVAEKIRKRIDQTPGLDFDSVLILEDKDEIKACLGVWDWRQVQKLTVEALNLRMQVMGWFLTTFRIFPQFVKPGDVLKQVMFTLIGYKDVADLATLIRYWNNLLLNKGVEQVFCICEQNDKMLQALNGFFRINTTNQLYIKTFRQDLILSDRPVFVDGIDL